MRRAKSEGSGDEEDDTDRSLFSRLLETVFLFFMACLLIKIGVGYILSVKVPLIIIALVSGLVVTAWRLFRWRRSKDEY